MDQRMRAPCTPGKRREADEGQLGNWGLKPGLFDVVRGVSVNVNESPVTPSPGVHPTSHTVSPAAADCEDCERLAECIADQSGCALCATSDRISQTQAPLQAPSGAEEVLDLRRTAD